MGTGINLWPNGSSSRGSNLHRDIGIFVFNVYTQMIRFASDCDPVDSSAMTNDFPESSFSVDELVSVVLSDLFISCLNKHHQLSGYNVSDVLNGRKSIF